MRIICAITACLLISTACVDISLSQAGELGEGMPFEGLRGLRSVHVNVAFFTNSDGNEITTDRIRTDAELRLRSAGIRVLTKEQWLQTSDMPELRIFVSAVKRAEVNNIFAYSILVLFSELVKPVRAPESQPVLAATWGRPKAAGLVGKSSLNEIRKQISDQVDEFINAFLAANPR